MADLALVFGSVGLGSLLSDLSRMEKSATGLGGTFSTMISSITGPAGIAAASAAVSSFAIDSVKSFGEFETATASLSAITGAAGDDLAYFAGEAKRMSDTVQGGATATVKAMELIGSAMPDLLSDTKGLSALTEKTILFADAAMMDVPAAATALTDALNQFKAPASEATAYMDALAAGAKYGSSTIPQSTQALLKFGAGAKAANIDIVESTAAIQALSTTLKGAEAGTALRNIILKMETAGAASKKAEEIFKGVGLNITKVGDNSLPLIERLTEMKKVLNDVNGPVEVFGAENVIAAQALFDSLPKYEALTKQLKEQGVTAEQAAVNNATLEKSILAIKNQINVLMIEVGEALAPAIRAITDDFRPAFESVKQTLTDIYGPVFELGQSVINLAESLGFGVSKGGIFVNIIKGLGIVLKIALLPMRAMVVIAQGIINTFQIATNVFNAVKDAVLGVTDRIPGASAALTALVNTAKQIVLPLLVVKDAWDAAFGVKQQQETMGRLGNMSKAVFDAGRSMGATNEQIIDFSKNLVASQYVGMTMGDTMNKLKADFAGYLESLKAVPEPAKAAEEGIKGLGDAAAGPASGSIDALSKKLSTLRSAFTATGSELTRIKLGGQISDVEFQLLKFSTSVDAIKPRVQDIASLAKDATQLPSMGEGMSTGGWIGELVSSMDTALPKVSEFATQMKLVFVNLKESVKSSMIDMAQDVAFNIGQAIGAGASVGDVFKNVLRELAVMIPKMVGMAMINQAAMVPSPASLPLALAGLALIGASGIISGAFKASDAKKASIPDVGSSAPMPSPDRRGLDSFGYGSGRTEAVFYIYGPSGERLTAYMEKQMVKSDRRKG